MWILCLVDEQKLAIKLDETIYIEENDNDLRVAIATDNYQIVVYRNDTEYVIFKGNKNDCHMIFNVIVDKLIEGASSFDLIAFLENWTIQAED